MRKLFKGRSTERDAFHIPRSVQQSIPIKRIYKDGIFHVSGRFSKTWRFFDVNYAVASPEKQMELFLGYCGVLNSLPIDAGIKLTLVNRQLNRQEFSRNLLMAYRQDGRDYMRREYNGILLDKASGSNNLVQEKYITVSVAKRSIEEACTFFARVGTDLTAGLSRMDSGIREIALNERLRLFHDFFRVGQESAFAFDLQTAQRRGHDFRDAIAPETLQFFHDHYAVDERVGRTLFLREYASFIKDTMITELMDYPRNMMLSIDIVPVATDEAVSEMHRRIMAVESDITRWQQRQNHHNNFSANIPYDLEQMRKETREFLDDLTARDQRMMYALVTLTHLADNEEQLEQDTEALSAIGRSHGCQFATMKHQQEDALNTVLPYGLRRIDAMRTLTTESTAVLLPFKTQEIMDTGGLYYGVNAVSRNLIICNRDAMLNGHGLYTGVSGSGKSMMAKQEIGFVGLNTNHDIIVVDPEREYGPLIRALGGEVITISASNGSYVNALDISKEYGDGRNPLVLKSEFIMSLCEQLMGAGEIGAKEKSIIDRCTANIYRKYIRRYEGDPPTLKDLYDDLMRQKEPVAHEIALALELFTTGSLNVFAHQTNIDTRNRIICYDIQDLGENLKPIGLLVMLDSILNRVIRNRQQGRYTHVYIDEIYLFFASPGVGGKSAINNYSSEFLYKCWKRFRKYYATLTGITQNVEECLLSDTARLMFANSEFLVLLNQAPTDRAELAKLLDETRGTPLERCVHTSILRSMGKAKYEPDPKGHFGLALSDYTHFTSPIRRYPDLAIHRILSDLVAGEEPELLARRYESFAAEACTQASAREVEALHVERSTEDCYKAEFMRGKLGQVFTGVVSGVAPHGIYVELPNTVEGLVHVSHLCEDKPELIEGMRFADPRTGKSWSLGDEVRVQVAKTDVALGKIDFILAGESNE